MIDVEISVVNHSEPSLVRRCLRSLPAACAGCTWAVSVVENLPRTGPPLTSEFPWVRVVANPAPLGFAANHTAVLLPLVRSGAARYVMVLNDDTELLPRSISAMVRQADDDPGIGAVGPLLRLPDGERQHSMYAFPTVAGLVRAALRPGTPTCASVESGRGWLSGACLLIRREAAAATRLFDTRFYMFYEDMDLAARLWDSGWRVALCHDASVIHFDHQTVSQPELRQGMECQMLRSCFLYFRKHRGCVAAWTVVLACRAALLARGLRGVVRASVTRAPADRSNAADLLRLAGCRPTRPLGHEVHTPGS